MNEHLGLKAGYTKGGGWRLGVVLLLLLLLLRPEDADDLRADVAGVSSARGASLHLA
jgi:hypothetical protein